MKALGSKNIHTEMKSLAGNSLGSLAAEFALY
jgi:hypothetical protein